ncbi:hypothetical protein [Escherichia coli]|uniref:hypothetical protein n=1 Tax=Escherichia coli TaxID=562 RepID=UPI0038602FD2
MAVVITYLADDNARNRRRARRQAQREQAMQEQRLARKIALKLSGCVRADKAASLGSLRCKKADGSKRIAELEAWVEYTRAAYVRAKDKGDLIRVITRQPTGFYAYVPCN